MSVCNTCPHITKFYDPHSCYSSWCSLCVAFEVAKKALVNIYIVRNIVLLPSLQTVLYDSIYLAFSLDCQLPINQSSGITQDTIFYRHLWCYVFQRIRQSEFLIQTHTTQLYPDLFNYTVIKHQSWRIGKKEIRNTCCFCKLISYKYRLFT